MAGETGNGSYKNEGIWPLAGSQLADTDGPTPRPEPAWGVIPTTHSQC